MLRTIKKDSRREIELAWDIGSWFLKIAPRDLVFLLHLSYPSSLDERARVTHYSQRVFRSVFRSIALRPSDGRNNRVYIRAAEIFPSPSNRQPRIIPICIFMRCAQPSQQRNASNFEGRTSHSRSDAKVWSADAFYLILLNCISFIDYLTFFSSMFFNIMLLEIFSVNRIFA